MLQRHLVLQSVLICVVPFQWYLQSYKGKNARQLFLPTNIKSRRMYYAHMRHCMITN